MSLTGKYVIAESVEQAEAQATYGGWFKSLPAARLQAANKEGKFKVYEVTLLVTEVPADG